MPWPQTGASHLHALLKLRDKWSEVKGFVVWDGWDLAPLDLLKQSGLWLLSTVLWGILIYYNLLGILSKSYLDIIPRYYMFNLLGIIIIITLCRWT